MSPPWATTSSRFCVLWAPAGPASAEGKSGALVRMHYTNDAESRLALESLKIFRDFGAIVGGECGFEPVGFVQLVGIEYRDALRRNVARQHALGIDTREVSLDD